jgi:hypothetical protein
VYEDDDVWVVISRTPAVETVQWMTVVAVLSFGAGLLAMRVLAPRLEGWWAAVWDRRLALSESDGGFSLRVLTVAGIAIFVLKVVYMGYGFLTTQAAPVALSWLFNGMLFVYYITLYALNARMFRERRVDLVVIAFDLAAFAYEATSGSKGRFGVFVVFPLLLIAVFQRRRLGWTSTSGVGAVVLVSVFAVYPLLVSYRTEISQATDPSRPSYSMMARAAGSWSDKYEDKINHILLGGAPSEQVIASTSLVFFNVRRDGSQLWQRLLFFWVPRAVWQDKPVEISGNELGRESYRVSQGDESTSVIPTGLGELYVYFGELGALWFGLAGLVFRLVEVGLGCFRKAEVLRVAASAYLFRTLPWAVTLEFETSVTSPLAMTLILFVLLTLLAFAAVLVARRTIPAQHPGYLR